MPEATLSTPIPASQKGRAFFPTVFFPSNVLEQNNFSLIRLALSILVILSHSFILSRINCHDALYVGTRGQIDLGSLAVNCFFSISGFLIANSWTQTGRLGAYLRKRSLRIFPGLIAAVMFCILIVGPLAGVHLAAYFRDPQTYRFAQILLLRDLGGIKGLPGVFHDNVDKNLVDGSLWTIRYEFFCYLLLPLLALCGLLRRRSVLLALFLGMVVAYHHFVGTLSVILARGHDPATTSLPAAPRLLIYFLAGVTFYAWRDRIPRSPLLLLFALAAAVLANGHDWHSERLNLVLPLAGTYIIFYLAYAKPLLPSLVRLTQKHDLSYGLYLFGCPIQQLLVHYAQIEHLRYVLTPLGLFFSALPLAFGMALLSWKYVEQPFLRLKTSRRAAPASESSSASALAARTA